MPPLPTGRKPAHAAKPTRPRYGNSLRKTLSERERPKPLQEPIPSRLGRLCRGQLRRLKDRPRRPGPMDALIQWRGEKINADNNLRETPAGLGVLVKADMKQNRRK